MMRFLSSGSLESITTDVSDVDSKCLSVVLIALEFVSLSVSERMDYQAPHRISANHQVYLVVDVAHRC